MTWTILKHWVKKSWLWLKTNWWAGVLLVGGFILYKFFLYKPESTTFSELYDKKVEQGKKEMQVLEEVHKEEVKQIERAQEDFKVVVSAIETERKESGEKIKKTEKKRIKEIVNMPEKDRAKALANEFGFEVVEAHE